MIGQTSFGRVEAPMGRVVRPWDVLDVHRACCSSIGRVGAFWASIGRGIRPWDGLGRPWGVVRSSDVLGGRMALYLPGDIMPSLVLVKPLWRRSAA